MAKPHPKAFRDDVVAVAHKAKRPCLRQVAKDFDVSEGSLANWMKRADIEDGKRPGMTARSCAKRRRIRLLEQVNEALCRAAEYLSQANLPAK